jgi:N-acetylmuramoyl-L-alanine amidase
MANITQNVQTKANSLKSTVANAANSFDTSTITSSAATAVKDLSNSIETKVGSVAGQIEGGVKSLTQKFDKFQGELNNLTTEGLLDDGLESLENMATDFVGSQLSGLASKLGLGANVAVVFSEPDSNGMVYPIESTLDEEGGISGTVASVIQLITGLGAGSLDELTGSLQQVVAEASPEGILAAGKDLVEGKIGAFTAESISSLAKDAIESVTDEIETFVTDAISNGVIGSLNNAVQQITSIDSDGFGELVFTKTLLTGVMPDATNELNLALTKVKTSPLTDLGNVITKNKEVKQNLDNAADDFTNQTGKIGAEVLASAQQSSSSRARYNKITEEKRTLVRTRIANDGETGIVQSLSFETFTDIRKRIIAFCKPDFIASKTISRVVNLSQGDARDFNDAVKILEGITNKSYNVIKSFLKTIDSTITSATLEPPRANVFDDPYVIGSFEAQWKKGAGDPVFPYVSSTEELLAELRNIKRDVTEFVVHWTETPTNKNIGSEEINKIHTELGFEGIGYHYVIRRDGSLQRGRPINLEGEHADVNEHDKRSIGIVFVGGINVPSGTPNIQDFVSVQSLTRSQINTFDHFCRSFFSVFPGGQALGHNDLDKNQNDPGFDVKAYARSNFNKISAYTDTFTQKPFTVEEINS